MEKYYEQSIEESVKNPTKQKEEKEQKKMLYKAKMELERSILDTKDERIKFLSRGLIASTIVSILLAISIVVLTPLKTAIPYLLRVDQTTGFVDKLEPYNASKTKVDEAVSRYFLARYVVDRESYDWYTIQSMFDFIKETSNNDVFVSYSNFYKSEFSPLEKLGKNMKMTATINSITFLNETTVQVRFTKTITENSGKSIPSYSPTKWLATISFAFDKNITTERQRLINPLGFIVKSYKVDQELN